MEDTTLIYLDLAVSFSVFSGLDTKNVSLKLWVHSDRLHLEENAFYTNFSLWYVW